MFSSTSLRAYITLHAHSDIELVVSLYIVETTVYNARINNGGLVCLKQREY